MKKLFNTIKTLKKGTIVRTILQILVYINQFIVLIGQSPFSTSPVYIWITFISTVLVTAVGYWYNNDWTKFAQISGGVFEMLKDGKITDAEIDAFIKKYNTKEGSPE